MQEQVTEKFDTWAVLELFGHQRLAGRVQEQSIGGASFVRVDVPKNQTEFAYTRYYNPSAIYSISPVPEEIARAVAKKIDNPPVYKWEIEQPALTAPADHAQRFHPGTYRSNKEVFARRSRQAFG